LLTIGSIEMLEIAIGVISRSKIEFEIWPIDDHFQMPVAAVLQRIVAGETENVIDRTVFLHLRKDAAEIVRIEERFSAGVSGNCSERVLRRRVAVEIV